MRFPRDLADHGRRHVQVAFDAGDAFGNRVVRDEEVGIRGELCQSWIVAVRVHCRAAFAETQGSASAGIDKHTRAAILPDEVAAHCALVLQLGATGAKYLHGDAQSAAGLGPSMGGN